MPATTPNPAKAKGEDSVKANGTGPQYVRCDLNKAQKEQLTLWHAELEEMDMCKWLYYKVERGHTVSLKCLEAGYQCSVTGTTEGSQHLNLCLIARASTPEKSIAGAMFRDTVILEGVWPASGRLDDLDF
jgi:hypothetical protein